MNLEYSKSVNLGDSLSPVVVNWMLGKQGIDPCKSVDGTKHLFAVGSVLGWGVFDACVWGSGIHVPSMVDVIKKLKGVRKLDVRAVRGPHTRRALIQAGYSCPDVYGDPAILMPLIYNPVPTERANKPLLILNHANSTEEIGEYLDEVDLLNIKTVDYISFMNQLVTAKCVISASLHGIILAEAYGIPCIYLSLGKMVQKQEMKFADWYSSTGRDKYPKANSLSEALCMAPADLPDLTEMQTELQNSFPYDLWE